MRNGNALNISDLYLNALCSYRTYEEWKPTWIMHICIPQLSSYRTYEEWKLLKDGKPVRTPKVLTVPMRNGNIEVPDLTKEVHQFLPYL